MIERKTEIGFMTEREVIPSLVGEVGKNKIIVGRSGCGKTHLMRGLMDEHIEKGRVVLMFAELDEWKELQVKRGITHIKHLDSSVIDLIESQGLEDWVIMVDEGFRKISGREDIYKQLVERVKEKGGELVITMQLYENVDKMKDLEGLFDLKVQFLGRDEMIVTEINTNRTTTTN